MTKDRHLQIRLTTAHDLLVDAVAKYSGTGESTFALQAALREARRVWRDEGVSVRDRLYSVYGASEGSAPTNDEEVLGNENFLEKMQMVKSTDPITYTELGGDHLDGLLSKD